MINTAWDHAVSYYSGRPHVEVGLQIAMSLENVSGNRGCANSARHQSVSLGMSASSNREAQPDCAGGDEGGGAVRKEVMTKSPLILSIPKADAEQKIRSRIEKGRAIIDLPINSREELLVARAGEDKWSDYNRELLKHLFENEDIVGEYNLGYGQVWGATSIDGDARMFREYMNDYITKLESIFERLELIPEFTAEAQSQKQILLNGDGVFIVHGHDETAKESAARFIEKLGLKAIILHEQSNAGRTIIEKFEANSNVAFALVLLTPDDIGAPKDKKDEAKPRARQNVILELGYFMGKLGRGRVCVLYKEGVEIPSDYQGVLYIPMDSADAWRMTLAKEIKEAGLPVDLNKL